MVIGAIIMGGAAIGATKLYIEKRSKKRTSLRFRQAMFGNVSSRQPLLFGNGQMAFMSPVYATAPTALYGHYPQIAGSRGAVIPQDEALSRLLDKLLRKLKELNKIIYLWWQQTKRWLAQKIGLDTPASSLHKPNIGMLFRYIGYYIQPYWREILIMTPCLLSFPLFSTYIALSLKYLLDSAVVGNVLSIFGAALAGFVAMTGLRVLGERLQWNLIAQIDSDIRHDVFEHLQTLSTAFYQRSHTGDLLTRFSSDTNALKASIQQVIRGSTIALSLLINLPLLFLLEWHLALLTLISLPVMLFVTKRLLAHASSASYEMQQVNGQLSHILQETLSGQAIIKGLSMDQWRTAVFGEKIDLYRQKSSDATFLEGLVRVAYQTSTQLTELLVYGSGSLLVISGALPISSLIAFIAILSELKKNVYLMSQQFSQLISHTGNVRRLDELFQEVPDVLDAANAIEVEAFSKEIRFEDVTFGYKAEQPVINQVNLTIPSGQHVAFVGSSGAGKSTILKLILRFYDVTAGRLLIDGVDIRQVTQASLRRHMSVVLQDSFLFDTTIYENILVSKPDATEEEVEAAAKAAEIHDFICTLPDGYQTKVGEAGGQLSGGQRQRVSIARALLRQPAILILDEPTASLDAQTTAEINKTLESLAQDRTVISVTHLFSSIVNADQIFVFEGGQIAESGTHEELLAKQGAYCQLWQQQQNPTPQLAPTHFFAPKHSAKAPAATQSARHQALA